MRGVILAFCLLLPSAARGRSPLAPSPKRLSAEGAARGRSPLAPSPKRLSAEGAARGQLSETRARALAQAFQENWKNTLAAEGKTLEVEVWWERDDVNATFDKWNGRLRVILFGGLLRRPLMTEDGMAATTCHELGHMLGGEPLWNVSSVERATNEGQADYWAASVCLKRVLAAGIFRGTPRSERASAEACSLAGDAALCERAAWAGYDMLRLFETGDGSVSGISFSSPSAFETNSILNIHASYQCRLDTFLAGASGARRPKCWYNPAH